MGLLTGLRGCNSIAFRALVGSAIAVLLACGPGSSAPIPAASGTSAQAQSGSVQRASDPTPEAVDRVSLIFSNYGGTAALQALAREKGFFRKYGLEVNPLFIQGSPLAVAAIASGEAQFAMVSGEAAVTANVAGLDLVFIASPVDFIYHELWALPSVSGSGDLRGKTGAVSRFGSSSDFTLRLALSKLGLEADKDVTVLEVGNTVARVAAMESGNIQVTTLIPPETLMAKRLGFKRLLSAQELATHYTSNGVATTRTYMRDNPELVRRFMKAMLEAIHYYKTEAEGAKAAIGPFLKLEDRPEDLEETYQAFASLHAEKPYPTVDGLRTVLEEVSRQNPEYRTMDPRRFMDDSVLRELDQSGFIDAVWGRRR